jgi:hypothetical protein
VPIIYYKIQIPVFKDTISAFFSHWRLGEGGGGSYTEDFISLLSVKEVTIWGVQKKTFFTSPYTSRTSYFDVILRQQPFKKSHIPIYSLKHRFNDVHTTKSPAMYHSHWKHQVW